MEGLPYDHLRLITECPVKPDELVLCTGAAVLEDFKDRLLVAFGGEWSVGFLTKLALAFMAVATAAMIFGARWFTLLFIQNESVVSFGSAYLQGLCLAQPFLCIDFIAVGVFQSCGMGRRALLFAVLRKIILEIPLLVLLDKLFPPYGLAYSQLAAEFILAAAALVILARIFRSLEKKNSPLEGGGGA